jgi:hypothetical protein
MAGLAGFNKPVMIAELGVTGTKTVSVFLAK